MKIKFLGTGTSHGIPVIGCACEVCISTDPRNKRLRCSLYFESKKSKGIIDCGPDFRYQCLRAGIKSLDAVLLSHEHNDHTAGLDDLRPLMFDPLHTLSIYCEQRVLDNLKLRFAYAFGENKYPGAPSFSIQAIKAFSPFLIGDLPIIPLFIGHGSLDILGYKIGDLVYITDANRIPPESMELIRNCSLLVISALHHHPHHAHFTLQQALTEIVKINPSKAYIIHSSHQMGLHAMVEPLLPRQVLLAYDGLEIDL